MTPTSPPQVTPEALTMHEQQQVEDTLTALGACWSTKDYKGAQRVMAGFLREIQSEARALAAPPATPQGQLLSAWVTAERAVATYLQTPPDGSERGVDESMSEAWGRRYRELSDDANTAKRALLAAIPEANS